jgi:hypothetical protein
MICYSSLPSLLTLLDFESWLSAENFAVAGD